MLLCVLHSNLVRRHLSLWILLLDHFVTWQGRIFCCCNQLSGCVASFSMNWSQDITQFGIVCLFATRKWLCMSFTIFGILILLKWKKKEANLSIYNIRYGMNRWIQLEIGFSAPLSIASKLANLHTTNTIHAVLPERIQSEAFPIWCKRCLSFSWLPRLFRFFLLLWRCYQKA